MELALSSFENSDSKSYSDRKQSELEYAEDIVHPSEDLGKLYVFPGHLNDSVTKFNALYLPLKCKFSLLFWIGLKPNFFLKVGTGQSGLFMFLSQLHLT